MEQETDKNIIKTELENVVTHHSLSDVRSLSEELSEMFAAAWVLNIEQAVGFLSSVDDLDIKGKDEFLNQAKIILGDEEFAKYSKQCDSYRLGCNICAEKGTDVLEDAGAGILKPDDAMIEKCKDEEEKGGIGELNE